MKKYAERLRRQEGFTLIELIAAISLFSMVVGIISMITMFGFRSYHKITIENSLRDEADLIMSSIITELYTYGPQTVGNTANGIELASGANRRFIEILPRLTSAEASGAPEGAQAAQPRELNIRDLGSDGRRVSVVSDLTGSTLAVKYADNRAAVTAIDSGLIEIKLVLTQKYDNRDYKLELNSKFGF